MKKQVYLGLTVAALCLLLVVALWWTPARRANPVLGEAGRTPAGGDFTLQSATGPVALHDFRGKVVVLYFGYTLCPDICPTSLAMIGAAFRSLRPDELAGVQGIFVSVDPQRDTFARLASYAPYFHPKILGITGTPAEVAEVAKLYGVVYHQVKDSALPPGSYIVDHTSFMYVIDEHGNLTKILPHGTTPAQLAAAIRAAMQKA